MKKKRFLAYTSRTDLSKPGFKSYHCHLWVIGKFLGISKMQFTNLFNDNNYSDLYVCFAMNVG